MFCGIDEAGRGPIAGPLAVAGCILNEKIEGLNDSKKLTEKKREKLYNQIIKASNYHIVFKSAKEIDELGISHCLKSSIEEIMEKLNANEFLMDGNTSFGIENLKHEIKADAKYEEVSAASILAKVSRDKYMVELASKFPQYLFEKHKGYGTKAHIEAVVKYGRCEEHRKSFRTKGIDY